MRNALPMIAFVLSGVCIASAVRAQNTNLGNSRPTRAFDVTSVKRNYVPQLLQRTRITPAPGRFTATNTTLHSLVVYAFEIIHKSQLRGGPDWINSARFNIEATAQGAGIQDMRPMVRRLLADRFGLVIKLQTRTLPVYRLVRARNDGGLAKGMVPWTCPQAVDTQSDPSRAECGTIGGGPNALMGVGVSMSQLAKTITQKSDYSDVDRIVIDETGITGTYNISLRFSATREHEGLRSERDPNMPSFPTALQEQLGLRLQPASAPVELLTIESAKWPENN